ncbi:MAG: hypothetical protein ABI609_01735 [Acidobacteriota bacterium]
MPLVAGLLLTTVAQAESPIGRPALTLAERIACRAKVEDVYWAHRIWPAENKTPKPPRDQVVSDAEIAAQVEESLLYEAALERFWQQRLTPEIVQVEIDRQAHNTRDSRMLRELWGALDNDPYLIAECLVRPELAERRAQELYATDLRLHSSMRERAQRELVAGMGPVQETDWVRQGAVAVGQRQTEALELPIAEWERFTSELAAVPLGAWSSLQESAEGFFAQSPRSRTADRVRVATLSWPKATFSSWWDAERRALEPARPAAANYVLAALSSAPCTVDTWAVAPSLVPPPSPRYRHSVVWTGTEMIVWGGTSDGSTVLNSGGRYKPATDAWADTSFALGVPSARQGHTAVWTGTEMIVWGGQGSGFLDTGGRYTPGTNVWLATGIGSGLPAAREFHTVVWTGSEMIVWGGTSDGVTLLNTGGRYTPGTDAWAATGTAAGVPVARGSHTALWTGSEMIVWGGFDGITCSNTGGRYTPGTNSWVATSLGLNLPTGRCSHTAVWTGTQMIVWGGANDASSFFNTGGRYTPGSDSWAATSTGANVPSVRELHSAVWTGSEMIVWGGTPDGSGVLTTGGRYTPGPDSWSAPTTGTNAPAPRYLHTAVWTGSEMLVWGGFDGSGLALSSGGRYAPSGDTWVPTNNGGANVPSERHSHTAVWTGSEMIVWGGANARSPFNLNTGGRYTPGTDSWLATSVGANVPPGSGGGHSAVWTGTEMIIWGGGAFTNGGGRYSPATNTWAATSVGANVPQARADHTAVWTGSEMIVWGGRTASTTYVNTGGRYAPGSNSWAATSLGLNVPDVGRNHSAVWTGTEMIVWGGISADGFTALNSGARYTPGGDSWTVTGVGTNVPSPRSGHTAVWTGTEMIIWGGFFNTGGRYIPSTDTWTATSVGANVPMAREFHTASWTGTEMIVWGGVNGAPPYLNSGGRYRPATNTWSATSTGANVPEIRWGHVGVWTGNEMIVWGGFGAGLNLLRTGGRYCAVEPGTFFTLKPCRVFDSRSPASSLSSGATRLVRAALSCSIPSAAKALSLNITVVTPSATGILQAFGGDQSVPPTSVLSFSGGKTRANNAIVQLALNASGLIGIQPVFPGGGTVDVVVDVSGYFE